MRSLPRAVLGAAAALFLTAGLPAASHAADEVTIDHIEAENGTVGVVLSVDGLPAGTELDPATISVDVDGRTVDSTAKTVSAGDVERSTVLVLDASKSMAKGGKFAAATAAVEAFLDAAPDDVAIGLVTFAQGINVSIEPTTDHDVIREALTGVELELETSAYDGIVEGVRLAGTDGSRSLLVLSDGADTSSSTTLDVAVGSASVAGVVVDVVSLASAGRAAELDQLPEATGGSVIPADPDALGAVFTARADALAQQLLVEFVTPEDVAEEASLTISVDAGGQTYSDSAFVSLGTAAARPDVVESGQALVSKPVMLLGAVALALGLGGLLAVVLTGATDTRSSAERRIDTYFEAGGGQAKKRRRDTSADLKGSAVALTDKVVSEDFETKISQRLAGAGSSLTASEWLLLHVGVAVVTAVATFVVAGPGLGVLGLLAGAIGPWIYLRVKHSRRLSAFNSQLAETLGLMAGGLQAGLSLPQAVDSVVREGNEPMAGELRRALVEQRLGVDITDALEGVGKRMDSDDFSWIVMAIRIQREVGGNLAEILHTVADTLRERDYLRRQVRALSAEGRLSGYILTALPVGLFVYMIFANPDYVEVLYTTVMGWVMLGIAAALLSLGAFAMSKLAKVEV